MQTVFPKTLKGLLIGGLAAGLLACGGDPAPIWEKPTIVGADIKLDEQNNINLFNFYELAHHSSSGQQISQLTLDLNQPIDAWHNTSSFRDNNNNQYRAYFTVTNHNMPDEEDYLQVQKFSETGQVLTSYSRLATQGDNYPSDLKILVDDAENIYVSYNSQKENSLPRVEKGHLIKLNTNNQVVFEKDFPQHPIDLIDVTPQGSVALKVRYEAAPAYDDIDPRYDVLLLSPEGTDIKNITPTDVAAGFTKATFFGKALANNEFIFLANLTGSTTQTNRVNVVKFDAQGNHSFTKPFALAESLTDQSKLILDESGNLVVAFTCMQSKCKNTTQRHQIILNAFDTNTGETKWQYKENTPTHILAGVYREANYINYRVGFGYGEMDHMEFDKVLAKNGQIWFTLFSSIPEFFKDQNGLDRSYSPTYRQDLIGINPQTITKTKQLKFLRGDRRIRDFAIDSTNQILITSDEMESPSSRLALFK